MSSRISPHRAHPTKPIGSTFVVEAEDLEIPPPLISFVRLLLLSPKDWEKPREKQKLPKPKLGEEDGLTVLEVISQGLLRRLADFPSPIEVILLGPMLSDKKFDLRSRPTGSSFRSRTFH